MMLERSANYKINSKESLEVTVPSGSTTYTQCHGLTNSAKRKTRKRQCQNRNNTKSTVERRESNIYTVPQPHKHSANRKNTKEQCQTNIKQENGHKSKCQRKSTVPQPRKQCQNKNSNSKQHVKVRVPRKPQCHTFTNSAKQNNQTVNNA
ncbi:hypothetical protein E2C01_096513 [Portunus trituberculatus]|uniref:Uncharacterized protein n=1 Tax=Portunus trituberculatus TaxID=210409 RepID=A0A5B7JY51_PORTR|nr:hypothetical protein [Portunus trituberculatus]